MKLSKDIARIKIYFDRSRAYIGYIQLALIFKIFLETIGIGSNILFIGGILIGYAGILLLGYLDTRFGIRSREIENNSRHNPILMRMLKLLEDRDK